MNILTSARDHGVILHLDRHKTGGYRFSLTRFCMAKPMVPAGPEVNSVSDAFRSKNQKAKEMAKSQAKSETSLSLSRNLMGSSG